MTTQTREGTPRSERELPPCSSPQAPSTPTRPTQLPLFYRYDHGPWDRAHHTAAWQEIAHALPRGLGIEYDGREWRIVTVSADMRRHLEALDIAEGEVIPDPVLIEQRRRSALARMQVAQARDVLRAIQLEHDIAREEGAA